MAEGKAEIFCAACERALDGPSEVEADTVLSCPGCGVSDTVQNIVREIQLDSANQGIENMRKGMAGIARKSKNFTFKAGKPKKVAGRFVIRHS